MIYMIRHGQTEMNQRQMLQGRSDHPLNENGIAQARQAEEIKSLSGNILLSTHAVILKGMLEYLTPESHGSYWSKYIGNCAVYIAGNAEGKVDVPKELSSD